MNRRDAVIRMATLMGASVLGPRLLAASFDKQPAAAGASGFSRDEIALLDEIGETIIPATDVPGAKAVQIGAFMAMMVNDCYEPHEQTAFQEGLRRLAADFERRFGKRFVASPAATRTGFLNELDREQRRAGAKQKVAAQPPHYFRMMKELTILGYFTSEIGCTQALRFSEVPGSYDGCAPYRQGDRAWAT
jgi:hypothetical protein